LVSLVSPDEQPQPPACIAIKRHYRVGIHDINEPLDGHILPAEEHVEGLLEVVRAWRPDDGPRLIHCMTDRVFYGQAGGGTCEGCHGSTPRARRSGPISRAAAGGGVIAV
jgi:hypothetical protein